MNTTTLAAVCVIILTLGSCTAEVPAPETAPTTGFTPSEAFNQRLTFETVKMDNHVDPLTVVGEVSFDEDNVVRVYPIVSGSVERIFFSLGDYVK
jgi:cobalt-zinc-cadmium efflux system membrane fusion protein